MLLAAKELPDSWSMVFMGSGDLEQVILDSAQSLNPYRNSGQMAVCLIPPAPLEDLPKWTSGADIGAILYEETSLNQKYCTPNKIWEYPVSGVPILCTDLPELGKIVKDNSIGLCLPKNFKPSDVRDKITELDEERLNELQQNCFNFLQHDNWSKYSTRIISLYEGLT